MAASATIYRAALNIANVHDHYYDEHALTIAKHPSENDFRMMIRLIAFAYHANEQLTFGEGIATEDEADLWQKEYNGDISLWIYLGQPDEKRIRKACGKAQQVVIYTYAEGPALAWFKSIESKLSRFKNLKVIYLRINGDIESLVSRSMDIQCNIMDNELTLIADEHSVTVVPEIYKD